MTLGLEEEDGPLEVVDRSYWEKKGSKTTVTLVDKMLEFIHSFAPTVTLKYNKFYIGLVQDGSTNNFVIFKPQKSKMLTEIRLAKSDELKNQIEERELDLIDYTKSGRYRIRLSKPDITNQAEFITQLLKQSWEEWSS